MILHDNRIAEQYRRVEVIRRESLSMARALLDGAQVGETLRMLLAREERATSALHALLAEVSES